MFIDATTSPAIAPLPDGAPEAVMAFNHGPVAGAGAAR